MDYLPLLIVLYGLVLVRMKVVLLVSMFQKMVKRVIGIYLLLAFVNLHKILYFFFFLIHVSSYVFMIYLLV
ncbi:unnamed protein product [Trichobilharzia regenti]|nr:unnamed protein product [Trichobilharzia regenti]